MTASVSLDLRLNMSQLSPEEMEKLTYPRPTNTDHTLDENESIYHNCPLDNGRHHTVPRFSLGTLDQLPAELLNMVLTQLDLQSLTHFRRVNQSAMDIVDSIPQYSAIISHAQTSLRAILSIGSGRSISCQRLYETLCTAECDSCGDFGGYLYLITCRRVCFLCFTQKTDYLPLIRSAAIRKFGLSREYIATLPAMRSVPGFYSCKERTCNTRLVLIDYNSARKTGIAVHGTVSAMERHSASVISRRMSEFRTKLNNRVEGDPRPVPREPKSDDDFDGRTSNPRRFMAIIRAPFLDRRTRLPEWGFHCIGCEDQYDSPPLHWRRKFIKESFEEHIKECGPIENGIHTKKEREATTH